MERSDEELASSVLEGDEEAFELMFTRYRRLVYAIAFQHVREHESAEDIVQETFLIVYPGFRFEAGR